VVQRVVVDDGRVLQYVTPECVSCSVEYYQDEQGQTTCKKCPLGYTSLITGARFCVKQCSPGNFSESGLEPCMACPIGTNSTGFGSTSCFNCNDEGKRLYCPGFVDPCEKCQHLCHNSTCVCHEGHTLSTDSYSCIKCAEVIINFNGITGLNLIKPTWHVAICNISDPSDALICSGSLINDQWVITSARCVCDHNVDINSLSLRVNKLRTCIIEEENEIDLSASEIHCHPNFNNSDDKLIDLALIKLSFPIEKDKLSNTLPLCIKTDDTDEIYKFDESTEFITYGLGNQRQKVRNNALVAPAYVSLSSNSACFKKFLEEKINYTTNSDIFCTNTNSRNRCVGNPGSAVINSEDASSKITFVGVISRFTKVCGKFQSYNANTKIQNTNILQWISSTIAERN